MNKLKLSWFFFGLSVVLAIVFCVGLFLPDTKEDVLLRVVMWLGMLGQLLQAGAMLANILYIDDYDVETENNGYAGLEKILKSRWAFDCIMLDLHMPIMNGFSVLEILKQNEVNIPVVIITAESTEENLLKTYPYNIADFICKPYDPALIRRRIRAVLRKDLD